MDYLTLPILIPGNDAAWQAAYLLNRALSYTWITSRTLLSKLVTFTILLCLALVEANAEPDFVGATRSGQCDAQAYADWQQSDHGRAMQVTDEATVLGEMKSIKNRPADGRIRGGTYYVYDTPEQEVTDTPHPDLPETVRPDKAEPGPVNPGALLTNHPYLINHRS